MIKKRTRPQPRVREPSPEVEETPNDAGEDEEEKNLPYVSFLPLQYLLEAHCCPYSIADLIELRKLRKSRQGIDAAKLTKGEVKKKRKKVEDEEEQCVSMTFYF